MLELNKIYCQDNVEGMKLLDDECIDLTVTSPPYDNLRQYNGYSFDFENVAKELYRVTKQGGVVVWVVGDATIKGNETCTSFRQALFFRDCGFKLLDTMIYLKQNYAPIYPSARRYASQFEYMFVFTKGKHKSFHAIQQPKSRNKQEKVGFRQKDGTIIHKIKEIGRETKDATNVWSYAVGGNKINHPAVFPQKLAIDHIRSWSNEGDIILDPFMGSGTTAVAALQLGRKYIGFEISQEYVDVANERIAAETLQLRLDI